MAGAAHPRCDARRAGPAVVTAVETRQPATDEHAERGLLAQVSGVSQDALIVSDLSASDNAPRRDVLAPVDLRPDPTHAAFRPEPPRNTREHAWMLRLLTALDDYRDGNPGKSRVTELQHSLQTATR